MTDGAPHLGELERHVRGPVVRPGADRYDELRRTFNAMIERRPAAIVLPLDAVDVSAAVRWAAEHDLPISVRGGGHSVAGHAVGDGALMIDLRHLRSVTVDPAARLADAGGGALLEDLDRATTAHGLVAPSGTYSETGIGGLTLGGGISYLLGTCGFACDSLVGAELVTGDGSLHAVDAETDPELLWALRGGGGNFGVVTRLRFALTPLDSLFGGRITFAGRAVPAILELLFAHQASGPDELTLQAVLGRNDTLGGSVVSILGAWVGAPTDAEAVFAPFRARPDVVADGLGPISYLELQAMGARMGSAYRHYWKGHFVSDLSPGLVDAIVAAHAGGTSVGGILVETIHGMAHRYPDDHAAFGSRAALANVSALGIWDRADEDDVHIAWVRESAAHFEPYSLRGGGYLNYSPSDETAGRVERAFGPERFRRLRAVKRRCDPDNRFRFNANIPPA